MPKLDFLSAAVWKIHGGGGPNDPPPWVNLVTVNSLVVRGLTLNVLKSNYVIFRPYQKTLSHPVQIMMYDNEKSCSAELEFKQYVKCLGLLIDSSLTWKNHIDQIALRISKTVGLLAKLRHFVPRITLTNIYKSLILPKVSYGLTVW